MTTLDFSDLPKRTSQCTADQTERVVLFLAEKPLSELRRRQEVIESQIRLAHRRAGNEPSIRGSDDHTCMSMQSRTEGEGDG